MRIAAGIAASIALLACVRHASLPASPPAPAALGVAPPDFDEARACGDWRDATDDAASMTHAAFPELDPDACYVRVRYGDRGMSVDPVPPGCGYSLDAETKGALERSIAIYDRIARGGGAPFPIDLACDLPPDVRVAAARHDATALRALERRLANGARYPYSAAAAFGFGHPVQAASPLVRFRPGDRCPSLTKRELDLLGPNVARAGHAAEAVAAGVAPLMIVSGGAVHSATYEAFAMEFIASCLLGLRDDRVLLDPCADHTHTNVRDTGALVVAIGGRTAYVVTDDGLQADYLQEWTTFDLVGASIDQRALRSWGYLVGAWRQASVGNDWGFWFSPYRFWSKRGKARDFTCQR